FYYRTPPPPTSTLFPYTTLFRSRSTRTRFGLRTQVMAEAVAYDAKSDGCFPLITNDWKLSDAELLAAHKYQPNLEKRHAQLKGRSEEHTSELQSRGHLVCRLLLE